MGVASLSVFRGNFALAKVSLHLISAHYMELRGVRFLEIENIFSSMVKSIRDKQSVHCSKVYRSVIREFTLLSKLMPPSALPQVVCKRVGGVYY